MCIHAGITLRELERQLQLRAKTSAHGFNATQVRNHPCASNPGMHQPPTSQTFGLWYTEPENAIVNSKHLLKTGFKARWASKHDA